MSLPTGHITNFQQFSKIFVEQYIVNKAPPRVSYDLFDIRQYHGESLRDYLNRFGPLTGQGRRDAGIRFQEGRAAGTLL